MNSDAKRINAFLDTKKATEEARERANIRNAVKEIMDESNATAYVREFKFHYEKLKQSADSQQRTVHVYMTTRSGKEIRVDQIKSSIGSTVLVTGLDDESVESHIFVNISAMELVVKVVSEPSNPRREAVVFN